MARLTALPDRRSRSHRRAAHGRLWRRATRPAAPRPAARAASAPRIAAIFSGSATDADYNALGLLALQSAEKEHGAETAHSESVAGPRRRARHEGVPRRRLHRHLEPRQPVLRGDEQAREAEPRRHVHRRVRRQAQGVGPQPVGARPQLPHRLLPPRRPRRRPDEVRQDRLRRRPVAAVLLLRGPRHQPGAQGQRLERHRHARCGPATSTTRPRPSRSPRSSSARATTSSSARSTSAWSAPSRPSRARASNGRRHGQVHGQVAVRPGSTTPTSAIYDFTKPLGDMLTKIEAGERSGYYPLGFDTGRLDPDAEERRPGRRRQGRARPSPTSRRARSRSRRTSPRSSDDPAMTDEHAAARTRPSPPAHGRASARRSGRSWPSTASTSTRRPQRGARPARRQRRRQDDPDERPLRPLPARRRHRHARRRTRWTSATRATPSPTASAWSTRTSSRWTPTP